MLVGPNSLFYHPSAKQTVIVMNEFEYCMRFAHYCIPYFAPDYIHFLFAVSRPR